MPDSTSLVADTIIRTVELGLTITGAAIDDGITRGSPAARSPWTPPARRAVTKADCVITGSVNSSTCPWSGIPPGYESGYPGSPAPTPLARQGSSSNSWPAQHPRAS